MQKFEHNLRTTLHTRSVESIMTRVNFYPPLNHKPIHGNKTDNISTYLRKFEIRRENENLAKRILDCESEHCRDRYKKEWKNTKRFLKVRSNFRRTLHAQKPIIYKFQPILGRGNLLVQIIFEEISSFLSLLSPTNTYLLTFEQGSFQVIPDKKCLNLEGSKGYKVAFYAPAYLKNKTIVCKILKTSQNDLYHAGKFTISLNEKGKQTVEILSKLGKREGNATFEVNCALEKRQGKENALKDFFKSEGEQSSMKMNMTALTFKSHDQNASML